MTECGSVGGGRFWYQLHPTFYLYLYYLYYLSGRREESFPTNRSNGNGEGREQRELVFRTSLRASYRRHLASSFQCWERGGGTLTHREVGDGPYWPSQGLGGLPRRYLQVASSSLRDRR